MQVEQGSCGCGHRLHAVAAAHGFWSLLAMGGKLHRPGVCRHFWRSSHGEMARRRTLRCGHNRKRLPVHRHYHGEQGE